MANYWAIAIGINQYQHFQSLHYAERDARSLHNFLVVEAGFAPERCLLLTDHTPVVGQEHATPTRETILSYLAQVCQHDLQPEDTLWCFFSGYGVLVQGKDYLMPINGDPTEVATTGIPLESLFSIFRAAPTSNIILALDINRSQGVLGGQGCGTQTLALAQEYGIATVLSCRPDQFSHETLGLRMGLFSAALLEGMSAYGCMTLEQLSQFLGDRLPELSEHHCRPRQDPLVYIPDHKRYQLILPGKTAIDSPADRQNVSDLDATIALPLPPVNPFDLDRPVPLPLPSEPDAGLSDPTPPAPPQPIPLPPTPEPIPEPEEGDEQTWNTLIKLGLLAIVTLLVLVILRNAGTLLRSPQPSPVGGLPSSPGPNPGATNPVVLPTPGAGTALLPQSSPPPAAIDLSVPPAPDSGGGGATVTPVNPGGQSAGGGSPPLASPNPGAIAPPAPLSDQAILNAARATLSRFRAEAPNNQVSDIVDAIRQVRQIRPDQPLYNESQQVIERWSQIILDIAMGRAQQRNNGDSLIAAQNYSGAIAAARMVPTDRPALHAVAQQLITEWSQKTFALANARASEGDLPLAIQVARQVPAGTAAHAPAQQAIASWQSQLPPPPPVIP